MLESVKIVVICILCAVLYGILHDQVTAHICVEYFSVFHPPVFVTRSPLLLGLGWGIIATWWVGAFLGLILAFAARFGVRPKLSAAEVFIPIVKLLVVMGASALLSGFIGFLLSSRGLARPPNWVAIQLDPHKWNAFMADWWAHSASYAVGFFGGIAVCAMQYKRRVEPKRKPT